MDDNTKVNFTRRSALVTAMVAVLAGSAGSPRIVGTAVGASVLAAVIGLAMGSGAVLTGGILAYGLALVAALLL